MWKSRNGKSVYFKGQEVLFLTFNTLYYYYY